MVGELKCNILLEYILIVHTVGKCKRLKINLYLFDVRWYANFDGAT